MYLHVKNKHNKEMPEGTTVPSKSNNNNKNNNELNNNENNNENNEIDEKIEQENKIPAI